MKTIILSIIALTFFTSLHAQEEQNYFFDIGATNLNYDKSESFVSGIALNVRPKTFNKFGFKIAYQGDYLILNQFIPAEDRIEKTNLYAELSYKF